MSGRLKLLFLFLLSLCLPMLAQQYLPLNQAAYNRYVLNSAAIGLHETVVANCHYKKNWLGLSDSPELVGVSVDGPFSKTNYAAAINLLNERAGIFSKTSFEGTFRYKLNLTGKHVLMAAISAGFQRQTSDFSKIKADAPEEFEQWPEQQAVTIPNAAFGLLYTYKSWLLGVSVNQMLQQNYVYQEPVYRRELHYGTLAHFSLFLENTFLIEKDTWEYTPMLILRSPQGLPVQMDLVNTIYYKKKVLFGLGYRHPFALYSSFGFLLSERLRVVYSYEYGLAIQRPTRGGHELGLRFVFVNKAARQIPVSIQRKTDAEDLQQDLDRHQLEMEQLRNRLDSLKERVQQINAGLKLLVENQVNKEEVERLFTTYRTEGHNSQNQGDTANSLQKGPFKYRVLGEDGQLSSSEVESKSSNYQVVLGVYQITNYAREFQKAVWRELGEKTELLELGGHPRNYVYVCVKKDFKKLKEARACVQRLTTTIREKNLDLLKGDAWILQTSYE